MVDCGNSRCAQERRLFKKELLSWSKKVPLMCGLEQVAEELVGADTMNKLLEPFNNRESREHSEHTDWEPCDTCYFCQSRTKMLFEALQQSYKQQAEEQQKEQQHKEQQVKQLQEQQQKLLEQHQEQQQTEQQPTEDDECNSEGATVTEEPGMKYLAQLLPFSYPLPLAFLPPNIENNMAELHSPPSDAPLDLSASSRHNTKVELDDQNRPPSMELKVPQVKKSGKRKDGSVKRNYTQEELSAALDDIRSGKLGTRRAAVLYGIPRSTLRNKICKISTEKQELGEPKLSMADLVQNGDFSLAEDSRSTGEAEEEAWEQKLEKLRKKHNISLGNERDFAGAFNPYVLNPLLDPNQPYGLTDAYSHELKLPLLPDLVRRLAEQRMELERAQNMSLMPVMPMALSLLSKPMEPDSSEIKEASDYSTRPSPPSPPSPASPTSTSTPLKIPSFKPSRSIAETSVTPTRDLEKITQSSITTGKIGDTLKDIIAKTIAEKVRSKTQVDDMYPTVPFPNYTFPSGLENGHNLSSAFQHNEPVVAPPPPVKRQRTRPATVANSLAKKDEKPVDGSKPVKKTRPKRGQYRKYNSQLLLEAVRAVQRGEMSVHRAGSYFGVPHSTLEYKVKERHLLRQKKVAEQKAAAEAAALAASENQNRSGTGSDDVSADDLSTSPAPGAAPIQNGTLPTEADYGAAGFALNTSASELLKKLQQKVQAKAMAGIENGMEETASQPERMETTSSGDVVVVQ
ncbi:unnamed protein product [Owenia fusiformis]|uniref:Uncharacterized protein n=1 Tax=Owenia fusiformis TaxID=6347 RepID=A0A8J1T7U1_OWEFU|nr:unnamed protein product [Owenia fusiformis]